MLKKYCVAFRMRRELIRHCVLPPPQTLQKLHQQRGTRRQDQLGLNHKKVYGDRCCVPGRDTSPRSQSGFTWRAHAPVKQFYR